MAGSSFGDIFRITTYGESHGKNVGVIIDGVPSGLELNENDINSFLQRRRPNQNPYLSQRNEDDTCIIMSGVFNGITTGSSIMIMVNNNDAHSYDYDDLKDIYRPGHADYTYDQKYSIRDYRGGGRSSGRETVSRVIAGAVASKILSSLGIEILCFTNSIANIHCVDFNKNNILIDPLYMPDAIASIKARSLITQALNNGDSLGGVISCIILNVPCGLGEPVFDKADALLSHAIMSIGSVKGVEIGSGFNSALMTGSTNNDEFVYLNDKISKSNNNAGGILGGITDGSPITINVAIKPTSSISKQQNTVQKTIYGYENTSINIKGRHDPCIVPRAVVVVEAMSAIVLVDLLLKNTGAKMDNLYKIYKNNL